MDGTAVGSDGVDGFGGWGLGVARDEIERMALRKVLKEVEHGKGVAGPRGMWESGRNYQEFHGCRGVMTRCAVEVRLFQQHCAARRLRND